MYSHCSWILCFGSELSWSPISVQLFQSFVTSDESGWDHVTHTHIYIYIYTQSKQVILKRTISFNDCRMSGLFVSLLFIFCLFLVQQPPVSHGLFIHIVSRSHTNDAPHSVELLWTSDQLVAETSTWQHITLKTGRHLSPPAGFEPTISTGERPQTYALDRAATGADCLPSRIYFTLRKIILVVTESEVCLSESLLIKLLPQIPPMAQQPLLGQGLLIIEASRSDSGVTSLEAWSSYRRDLYLTTNNTHNRRTSMAPGGIRTRNPSKRATANPRVRPRSHWDRLVFQIWSFFVSRWADEFLLNLLLRPLQHKVSINC